MIIKLAKRLDLNYSHHKKEMIIMWCNRGANYLYSDDHITMYICITQYYMSNICLFKNVYLFSLVVAHSIQFLDQGSILGPLHWECRVLATGPQGSPYGKYISIRNVETCGWLLLTWADIHISFLILGKNF